MSQEGWQYPELFCSENAIQTVVSHDNFENFGHKQQGNTLTFILVLVSWLQRCKTLVKMIWADGLGCYFAVMMVIGLIYDCGVAIILAIQMTLKWAPYISNTNTNRFMRAAQIMQQFDSATTTIEAK
jgi:hypothetical protein